MTFLVSVLVILVLMLHPTGFSHLSQLPANYMQEIMSQHKFIVTGLDEPDNLWQVLRYYISCKNWKWQALLVINCYKRGQNPFTLFGYIKYKVSTHIMMCFSFLLKSYYRVVIMGIHVALQPIDNSNIYNFIQINYDKRGIPCVSLG